MENQPGLDLKLASIMYKSPFRPFLVSGDNLIPPNISRHIFGIRPAAFEYASLSATTSRYATLYLL